MTALPSEKESAMTTPKYPGSVEWEEVLSRVAELETALKEANDRAERLERELGYWEGKAKKFNLHCQEAQTRAWKAEAALAALPADREPVAMPNLTAIEIASPFNACIHKGFCLSLIRLDAYRTPAAWLTDDGLAALKSGCATLAYPIHSENYATNALYAAPSPADREPVTGSGWYRKKPIAVKAVQWFKHGDHPAVEKDLRHVIDSNCGLIKTLEDSYDGAHFVQPGDWIITGIKGEHYAIKPDIFTASYEPAPSPSNRAQEGKL